MVESPQNSGHNEAFLEIDGKRETKYDSVSDSKIWKAFREGDDTAFVHIYNTYVNQLFNYGIRFTQDRDLVKDCLQDFFIYLRNSRSRLGDTNAIKLYLYKAFRRRLVDYLTSIQKAQAKNETAFAFELQSETSHEVKLIDSQLKESQLSRLNEVLKSLSEREREVIYYFYYEGLSYQEIAEIFGFTHTSSARRLLYNTLSNLKDLIGPLFMIWLLLNFFKVNV
ncbi:sigma-70 family RNA polymerase sigma factor [Limibacter armeniacum]|uniref:RNA polymerase sigma factor n=1 Tax=Limibacter armeniacum TaxID=466084 RepID=UPI002FE55C47